MLKPILIFFTCTIFLKTGFGQTKDTTGTLLPQVTISAYEQNRSLKDIAAPVAVIGDRELHRFGTLSMLSAINAVPGVRMEERSPGSYRLNIRGSSLRSPFGVRNVKIYLNGIPFTDPGGSTYFNQLSFFDIAGLEILKGPGSSLYGAGTGGVMLIKTMKDSSEQNPLFNFQFSKGDYNKKNLNGSFSTTSKKFSNKFSYSLQSSDGYRDQSAMHRETSSWQGTFHNSDKHSISAYLLFGNLSYETPGALTKAQYIANPRSARPAAGTTPGAIENKASISQKMFWGGLRQQYKFNDHFENITSLYGAFSKIENSAILNYEKRREPHFGGRTSFGYTAMLGRSSLKVTAGAEVQQGYFSIKVYKNKAGEADSLRNNDDVRSGQLSVFTQATIEVPGGWIASAGISLNKTNTKFTRVSLNPSFKYKADYNNEWAPRVSLLKHINPRISIYGVISKGFSPPTISELLPSTNVINTDLEAEHGINYEAGIRGSFIRNRLTLDVNAFSFGLKNAITQRRDQSGADYFVNAGNTKQKGIESSLTYQLTANRNHYITSAVLWANYTFNHFRYKTFKQGANDFSGNRIPGVAPNTFAGGLDISSRPGMYISVSYFYSDHIALNDAGSEYASSYQLPGFRVGYKKNWVRSFVTDFFLTGDNIFNEKYSLGNDINAQGGRFYNAAPGVNFQAGISIQL